jgi:peptide/nickel transport system permease protein
MTSFLLRRLLAGFVTLLVFVTMLFFLAEILIPGDFVTQFTLSMPPEQRAELREELGLNLPVWHRYLLFIGGLATGDLGSSYWGEPVLSILLRFLPWTLLVLVISMGIAFPLGHLLGRVAGWHSSRQRSSGLTIGAVAIHTIFPPLLVFLLVVAVFSLTGFEGIIAIRNTVERELPWPTGWVMLGTIAAFALVLTVVSMRATRVGRRPPAWWVWLMTMTVGPALTWSVLGIWDTASDMLLLLLLPIIAVALLAIGEVILVVKSAITDVRSEDFIVALRAKGLSEQQIRDHHAARVALLPTLSKLTVSIPFVLVGLMIIEISFRWPRQGTLGIYVPGVSSVMFTSLEQRNVPVVIGGLFAVGLIVLGVRLILDFLHAALDPRIRFEGGSR